MKRFMISAVLLGFLGISLLVARTALTDQPNEKTATKAASLEELQKERIETLEKIVPLLKEQTETVGTATVTDVFKAQNELIEAKLEATDKVAERITLLEGQLKVARELFDLVEGQRKVGFGHVYETDVLRAKAHCLAIEIKLVKERNKAKSATAK